MKKIRRVITNDGSTTFFNEEVEESYHSMSGAEEEAKKKYAELVKKFLTKKEEIVVYDVCFGLGYNSVAVLDEELNKKITFFCFENDKEILKEIPLIQSSFKNYHLIKGFINKFLLEKKESFKDIKVELKMVFGDFKKRLKEPEKQADYVLFDPFSPSKEPTAWTKEVFSELQRKMNQGGLLFTYSCSKKVRENMCEAGFEVIDGPVVGRKSPSTIARKS